MAKRAAAAADNPAIESDEVFELAAEVFDAHLAADMHQFQTKTAEGVEVRQCAGFGDFEP